VDWLLNPEILASLVTLTALEIVLGIDNIVMIAVIANALPERQRDQARLVGLGLALVTRLLLLFVISYIAGLVQPLFSFLGQPFSGRDLIMLGGGLFLIWKAVHEMHLTVEEAGGPGTQRAVGSFSAAIAQIVLLDVVFSFDSVITAVGMARDLWVMVVAIIIAMAVMLFASGPIMRFIHAHPTVKMLALAFVLLIGMALLADGFQFHLPKGYIYAAMAFSVLVESLNVMVSRRRARARALTGGSEPGELVSAGRPLKVLIPVDGSPSAERAIRQVAQLARNNTAVEVHLVHVRPTIGSARSYADPAAVQEFQRQEADRALAPMGALAKQEGLTVSVHVATGSLGEAVARLAREIGADRIVMGTRIGNPLSGMLLGNSATDVIQRAPVPVTLVK
jgi:predicted tellurium resistance membrane protein TerC/nucleotide-binding universal stress UspA family protein